MQKRTTHRLTPQTAAGTVMRRIMATRENMARKTGGVGSVGGLHETEWASSPLAYTDGSHTHQLQQEATHEYICRFNVLQTIGCSGVWRRRFKSNQVPCWRPIQIRRRSRANSGHRVCNRQRAICHHKDLFRFVAGRSPGVGSSVDSAPIASGVVNGVGQKAGRLESSALGPNISTKAHSISGSSIATSHPLRISVKRHGGRVCGGGQLGHENLRELDLYVRWNPSRDPVLHPLNTPPLVNTQELCDFCWSTQSFDQFGIGLN